MVPYLIVLNCFIRKTEISGEMGIYKIGVEDLEQISAIKYYIEVYEIANT